MFYKENLYLGWYIHLFSMVIGVWDGVEGKYGREEKLQGG